jgi:hypothetical protein
MDLRRTAAGIGTALALTGPAVAAPSPNSFERCCFDVHVDVAGRLVRGEYTATWRWSVSHRSLFVDKGRIFAALTAPPGERLLGRVRFHFREEAGRCRREVARSFRSPAAFVSLEDSLTASDSLVARAGVQLKPHCGPPFADLPGWLGPFAVELPAPARTAFRRDRVTKNYRRSLDRPVLTATATIRFTARLVASR